MTRRVLPCAVFAFVLGMGVFSPPETAQTFSLTAILDKYVSGQFDAAVNEIKTLKDFDRLRKALEDDSPAWIAAVPDQQSKRELAAATLALEAARIDEWHDWKWIQVQPVIGTYHPRDVLSWRPAPRLIEWGCELLSSHPTPRPIERWWQLAALAVAQRSEDFQFLLGNLFFIGGRDEMANPQKEIQHLLHVMKRFPDEPRFTLAQGIAAEWRWPRNALPVFESLTDDPSVGTEALVRLGAIQIRAGRDNDGMKLLQRADKLTRDPYLVYLANFLMGKVHERQGHEPQAEVAYRRALAAVPGAQSASVNLGAMLFRVGLRVEGRDAAREMLETRPPAYDPWREYAHADDRFWPMFLAKLRKEILR